MSFLEILIFAEDSFFLKLPEGYHMRLKIPVFSKA